MTFRETRYGALASALIVAGMFLIGFTGSKGSMHHASHLTLATGGAILVLWAALILIMILDRELR